jgi:hypothetical protein
MEVGEQISIMPLEDKDHHGGIRVAILVALSCQPLIIKNQKRLTREEHATFYTPLPRLKS